MERHAASPFHDFSFEELFDAFRQVLPEEDAHDLASGAVAEYVSASGEPESVRRAIGVTFTDETLIILAAMSEDLEAKVAAYRLKHRLLGTPAMEQAWERRMRSLRAHVKRKSQK